MKVASYAFIPCDDSHPAPIEKAVKMTEAAIASAKAKGIELLVFPALTGSAFSGLQDGYAKNNDFFDVVRKITKKYLNIAVCPGSMWRREEGGIYHYSTIYQNGEVLLEQRQLYLSRYERTLGLARGEKLEFTNLNGFKTCIILSTDVFYPQVSRYAALCGANLVLCPVALEKRLGAAMDVAGVWREVQQNQFFAVESCLCGTLAGREYYGEPAVHAPLAATPGDDGFLAKGGKTAIAEIDEKKRQDGIRTFDVLSMLNPELYRKMAMFGGRKKHA